MKLKYISEVKSRIFHYETAKAPVQRSSFSTVTEILSPTNSGRECNPRMHKITKKLVVSNCLERIQTKVN